MRRMMMFQWPIKRRLSNFTIVYHRKKETLKEETLFPMCAGDV